MEADYENQEGEMELYNPPGEIIPAVEDNFTTSWVTSENHGSNTPSLDLIRDTALLNNSPTLSEECDASLSLFLEGKVKKYLQDLTFALEYAIKEHFGSVCDTKKFWCKELLQYAPITSTNSETSSLWQRLVRTEYEIFHHAIHKKFREMNNNNFLRYFNVVEDTIRESKSFDVTLGPQLEQHLQLIKGTQPPSVVTKFRQQGRLAYEYFLKSSSPVALQLAMENCQSFIDPILTLLKLPQIVIDLPQAKVTHITIGKSGMSTSEEIREHHSAPSWTLWSSAPEAVYPNELNISTTSSVHSLSPPRAPNPNSERSKRPLEISEDLGDHKRCRYGTACDRGLTCRHFHSDSDKAHFQALTTLKQQQRAITDQIKAMRRTSHEHILTTDSSFSQSQPEPQVVESTSLNEVVPLLNTLLQRLRSPELEVVTLLTKIIVTLILTTYPTSVSTPISSSPSQGQLQRKGRRRKRRRLPQSTGQSSTNLVELGKHLPNNGVNTLTTVPLSAEEEAVLSLGLSFVPPPVVHNLRGAITQSLDEYIKQIRTKNIFEVN